MRQRSEIFPAAGRVKRAEVSGSRGAPKGKGLNFISPFPLAVYTYCVCQDCISLRKIPPNSKSRAPQKE